MPIKVTALDGLILAVVAAVDAAVTYPVYDGPPSKQPNRGITQYVAIFATEAEDQSQADDSAVMDQVFYGLGQVAREEHLSIKCVAGAKASTVTAARSLAMSVIQDVGAALPRNPTPETYGCLISAVDAAKPHNTAGGAVVTIQFTIYATARLT
jgi:hypothetical protein